MMDSLTRALFDWYKNNKRKLPWRNAPTPYHVWVSEIMLQQTRVETVIPYYKRWMAALPDIFHLANATQHQVLNLWEGLGYYTRARNLHKAAKIVLAEYNGKLPADIPSLRKLPGIGPYTAAAIASIAFGMDVVAIDGNLRRVIARLENIQSLLGTPDFEKQVTQFANSHLPPGHAGNYNQALMDLGATICLPRQPRCNRCPLQLFCSAYQAGEQAQVPIRRSRASIPHYTVTAAIIQRNDKVLIAQRPADGLLGNLWEFPGGKQEKGEDLHTCLQRELQEELGVSVRIKQPFGIYSHAYTHFKVTLHAFRCELIDSEPEPREHHQLQWVTPSQLADFPMGKIDRQIASRLADASFQD